VLDSKFNTPW
jgi:hypothetical protein